jgi:1,4-dihydroxy-2-naphthoyl-CoA synthase
MQLVKCSINRGLYLKDGLDFELISGLLLFWMKDEVVESHAFLENREPAFERK